MNCEDTVRSSRYSEFAPPPGTNGPEGWCASADDYYNENYLPNDSHIAGMPTGQQNQPPSYPPYFTEYHGHQPPPHHHNQEGSEPPHLHPPPSHPPHHQVSNFPQKRSPPEVLYASNLNNNNTTANYSEPKSPPSSAASVTTSPPWNSFHSFYHKNPSASPPNSNNSIGTGSPPPTTLAVSSGDPNLEVTVKPGEGSPTLPRPSFKRRNTANKKERRRTQSINNAFAELRDCIPNVPADTKLSEFFAHFFTCLTFVMSMSS